MGGFLSAATEHHIVPTVWANAEPYGRVTADAFGKISNMILDKLSTSTKIDAVYLDLHGAMVTETHEDGEGELLRLIRDRVGIDIPDADLSIVVTTERVQCLDQGLFRELGIEPKDQSIVVVKSTVHFRADFENIASEIILAACPGTHPCNLEIVPYQQLRAGVRLGPGSKIISSRVTDSESMPTTI